MSRLIEIEPDIRPYLATIVVRAVQRAGQALTVPEQLRLNIVTEKEYADHQLGLAAKTYNPYGALGQMVHP